MPDKSNQLVLEALTRAVADPTGVPLHGSKAVPGLFATGGPAKLAAQFCKEQSYLKVVRTETKGKSVQEICAITEKGLAFLLSQASPKQVLEDLVRALEARQDQVNALLQTAQETQASLDALKGTAEKVLAQLQTSKTPVSAPCVPSNGSHPGNGSETWKGEVLAHLAQWQASGALEDCSLADVYRQARTSTPSLSIGHFHDGLRQLHQQEKIYLHPWTGPLYEIPEPTLALLVGHEIAYYASIRK